jgi:hypothetical protein
MAQKMFRIFPDSSNTNQIFLQNISGFLEPFIFHRVKVTYSCVYHVCDTVITKLCVLN